jgi:hypothetical protein
METSVFERNTAFEEMARRIALELKSKDGAYLKINELLEMIPNAEPLRNIVRGENFMRIVDAPGSSKNHQAWKGGYIDHVVETMNIACQLYWAFERLGRFGKEAPFVVSDALVVLFLHDIEKPWKYLPVPNNECLCGHLFGDHNRINPWSDAACRHCTGLPRNCNMYRPLVLKTKEDRRAFRDGLIEEYGIMLCDAQKNALRYVEGVPDSEYTPGERTMGELAAFCHCCDILSARLWHDWGIEHSWTRG